MEQAKPVFSKTRLTETLADLAFIAGAHRAYSGDSREDINTLHRWAAEFEALRQVDDRENETYNGEPYMTAIELFAYAKLASGELQIDTSHEPVPGVKYDNAELQICLLLADGETCEALGDDAPDTRQQAIDAVEAGTARTWMYSVYWHCANGGVEHVADFVPEAYQSALQLFAALRACVLMARHEDDTARAAATFALGKVQS